MLDSIKVIHCFYIMVKLILNAFNIFLTSNPSWFLFILKTNQTWALYKLKLIGFEFKINTNLQLGLRLKKLLSWVKINSRKLNQIDFKRLSLIQFLSHIN